MGCGGAFKSPCSGARVVVRCLPPQQQQQAPQGPKRKPWWPLTELAVVEEIDNRVRHLPEEAPTRRGKGGKRQARRGGRREVGRTKTTLLSLGWGACLGWMRPSFSADSREEKAGKSFGWRQWGDKGGVCVCLSLRRLGELQTDSEQSRRLLPSLLVYDRKVKGMSVRRKTETWSTTASPGTLASLGLCCFCFLIFRPEMRGVPAYT